MDIYTDPNYAMFVIDRRSTSEYCMFLEIWWLREVEKQNVVATASVDDEFW